MVTYKSFTSDGLDIAFFDEGEGDPVVLVHGFASNASYNWINSGWVRHLNRAGYRVIALDNRGHGRSDAPHDSAVYGAELMAGDVHRLIGHLGLGKADVMGFSMGARIAAFLAIAHPESVRSVIFSGLGRNMVRGMAGTGPIANALEAPSADDVKNPTALTFRTFAESTKSDLKALAACIRASRTPVTAEALATIACPVLVAVGTGDVIAGPAAGLAELIPGAIALEFESRDHIRSVSERAFKQGVLEFLSQRP